MSLRTVRSQIRRGDPLDLTQVTDMLQGGVDASVVEQGFEREELSGFHVIDERDFAASHRDEI